MIKKIFLLLCMTVVLPLNVAIAAQKIIYVPIDNRPVNLSQAVTVIEKLGYEVAVPPDELLGSWDRHGDPDRLWDWVQEEAGGAKAAVISTDAMLYGSLVGSRQNTEDASVIMARAQKFAALREQFPRLPIYALGTIMRTPSYNSLTSLEAPYYATHGERIFRYTALKDKEDMGLATKRDLQKIKDLEADIPAEYLSDWFAKRERNFGANAYFIDLARQNIFNYFLLGCDDSAAFSRTHMESRKLSALAADMGKTKCLVASGADELGMLMLSRAVNDLKSDIPFLYVQYSDGKGAETIPAYSNDMIKNDVAAAITAAGGIVVSAPERAELIVAIHTAYNGRTIEASTPKNNVEPRQGATDFVKVVKGMLDKGYPVGLADISTSNGADNGLMHELQKENLLFKLSAYGGWNTATNSSGFMIGTGVLNKWLTQNDIYDLLLTRYLDDWAYQANVRQEVAAILPNLSGEMGKNFLDGNFLDGKWGAANEATTDLVEKFAREHLRLPTGYTLRNLKVRLPWNRLFECDPHFELTQK